MKRVKDRSFEVVWYRDGEKHLLCVGENALRRMAAKTNANEKFVYCDVDGKRLAVGVEFLNKLESRKAPGRVRGVVNDVGYFAVKIGLPVVATISLIAMGHHFGYSAQRQNRVLEDAKAISESVEMDIKVFDKVEIESFSVERIGDQYQVTVRGWFEYNGERKAGYAVYVADEETFEKWKASEVETKFDLDQDGNYVSSQNAPEDGWDARSDRAYYKLIHIVRGIVDEQTPVALNFYKNGNVTESAGQGERL